MFSGDEIEKYVKVLSGGEKARVALARMLVQPSHILLLDEPTNHLDMVTRNVVEQALIKFSGSIVCISHDRHFLNAVTNLTCEVDNCGVKLFEGNYEYYEWKKKKEFQNNSSKSKVKNESRKKTHYKLKKKARNRLAWIDKRFTVLENKIEEERALTNDPANNDDYEILQNALDNMNALEKEYLDLMEEQESLLLN